MICTIAVYKFAKNFSPVELSFEKMDKERRKKIEMFNLL
jgi:hypothetical protein